MYSVIRQLIGYNGTINIDSTIIQGTIALAIVLTIGALVILCNIGRNFLGRR